MRKLAVLCEILASLLLPLLFVRSPEAGGKRRRVPLRELPRSRYCLLLYAILAIGFAVRLIGIGAYPVGLNQDEASAAYDAYAILTQGIDRNGQYLPVHLIAWGSGQNALYSYLCMPFFAAFGLTVTAARLPMALVGCATLPVTERLLRRMGSPRLALIGTALTAISPWHILKSRWALESNLFPDLVLWACLMLVIALQDGRMRWFCGGCALLGLSAYSYGTAYLFLPVFMLTLLTVLLRRRQIRIRQALAGAGVLICVALPIIVFVWINTFNLPDITTPWFTIPCLTVSRFTQVASVFGSGVLQQSLENFRGALKILLTQEDGLCWNSIPFFGLQYVFCLPLTLLGFLRLFRERSPAFSGARPVLAAWLAAGAALMFVVRPNINRLNAVWLPLILLSAFGLDGLFASDRAALRRTAAAFCAAYAVSFASLTGYYFTVYQTEVMSAAFSEGLGQAIPSAEQAVEEGSADRVVVTSGAGAGYIYYLFYTAENPWNYLTTAQFSNKGAALEQVTSYGHVSFFLPPQLERRTAYVLLNSEAEALQSDPLYASAEKQVFARFTVLVTG